MAVCVDTLPMGRYREREWQQRLVLSRRQVFRACSAYPTEEDANQVRGDMVNGIDFFTFHGDKVIPTNPKTAFERELEIVNAFCQYGAGKKIWETKAEDETNQNECADCT